MKNNFDLKKFLIENQLTKNSKTLQEALTVVGHTEEELKKNAEELVAAAEKAGRKATIEYNTNPGYEDQIDSVYIGAPGLGTPDEVRAVQDRQFADYKKNKKPNQPGTIKDGKKLKKLTVGGKTYVKGEEDSNGEGRIETIEKYSNGYLITGGIYSDYGDGDGPKEQYSYAIDLKGNETDEEDLDMFNEAEIEGNQDGDDEALSPEELANKHAGSPMFKEDFAPSPNEDVPDANAEEFDIATAFKKAGVDMSKPVMVLHAYGSASFGGDDKYEMSAEAAIKKLEAERQENQKNYTDDGEEVPSDMHSYEFDNYSVLEEEMPEGHEYKLSYGLNGDYTYSITQEKSGLSEISNNNNKEMKNNFDLKKFLIENKLTKNSLSENIEAFSDTIQVVGYPKTVEDALKVIERYERDRDPVSREEAKEIIADMRATDDDDFDRNITNLIAKAFNIKLKGVNEDEAGKEVKTVSFPNGLTVTVGEPHPEEGGIVNFIRKGEDGYEIGFEDGDAGGSYSVDSKGEFLDKDDDEGFATDIVKYIADTYIQNAKDGDKAYAEFRDLNIRDAAFDVAGILQDRKHPLYGETKKEYQIVSRDKKRGLFEAKVGDNNNNKKMKNNFDLKKFLTENKLTANSRQIVNENQLPDATKDLKASDAFKAVGIDMNEPVLVLTQDGGHGEQETKGTVSAQEALKMFQQLRAKGMEDDKQDYYEFENEINFSAEGYEYKIAYFEEESTTTALMQKSGVNEIDADLLKRAQNTPAPKDGSARLAKRKASLDNEKAGTLQVSKGPNAEQEQKVIDIARDAIALMDEQPGTNAADALNSVLGI